MGSDHLRHLHRVGAVDRRDTIWEEELLELRSCNQELGEEVSRLNDELAREKW